MFCKYCGAATSDDSIFCPKCGKNLKDAAAPSPVEAKHQSEEVASTSHQGGTDIDGGKWKKRLAWIAPVEAQQQSEKVASTLNQGVADNGENKRKQHRIWLAVAGALILGAVGKAIIREYDKQQSETAAVAKADQIITKLQDDGIKRNPELPSSEAMKQEAIKQTADELAKHGADKKKQAQIAAEQFLGFFLVNTRARVDYCKGLGVDITAFRTAFESAHRDEIARAAAIHQQHGRDMAKDSDKLYRLLGEQFWKIIETDMRDAAKQLNTDQSGACKAMAELANEVVEEIRLRKTNPTLHKALMGY